jgi:hypothetical protein
MALHCHKPAETTENNGYPGSPRSVDQANISLGFPLVWEVERR